MSAILSIAGVSHHYGAMQALNDVSFDVEKGSFALLLGGQRSQGFVGRASAGRILEIGPEQLRLEQ